MGLSISSGPPIDPDEALRRSQAVQFVAAADACERCRWLDGLVISAQHADLQQLRPPFAAGCQSLWVYVPKEEQGVACDAFIVGLVPSVGEPCRPA